MRVYTSLNATGSIAIYEVPDDLWMIHIFTKPITLFQYDLLYFEIFLPLYESDSRLYVLFVSIICMYPTPFSDITFNRCHFLFVFSQANFFFKYDFFVFQNSYNRFENWKVDQVLFLFIVSIHPSISIPGYYLT